LNKKNPNSRLQASSSKTVPILIAAIASVLLLASLRLPLWHMRLEAPQYRDEEALKIAVHPNAMKGDLRELKVLNQYIGVHVPPTLPQFTWLPSAITAAAMLGLGASFAKKAVRARALTLIASSLALALVIAAVQARFQMHDIGHKRDQKTVLAGLHDFTPPFLGVTKIAQFTVSSRFGAGAWLIGSALALQLSAARTGRRVSRTVAKPGNTRETVETVNVLTGTSSTQLKLGVNENCETKNPPSPTRGEAYVGGYKTLMT
jgi:hypothetical protein